MYERIPYRMASPNAFYFIRHFFISLFLKPNIGMYAVYNARKYPLGIIGTIIHLKQIQKKKQEIKELLPGCGGTVAASVMFVPGAQCQCVYASECKRVISCAGFDVECALF